jgi:RNA polymerase sigma-70 factor (ECF subfamily)
MPTHETSDADLSRRCREGDPEGWRELVRRHSPMVYRLALRMLGAGADADDACQETFLRVHRSFDSFDPTRPLEPWIARIAHNVCLRRLGATSRKVMDPTEPSQLQGMEDDRESGPEERAARGEAGELLEAALGELRAQDRAIVLMRYREGLSLAEVAEATEMPVNTVKTRLYRARGALRRLLVPLLKGA